MAAWARSIAPAIRDCRGTSALKILPDAEASDLQWRTRFEREARALASLNDDYDIHRDGRTLVAVRPVNRTQGREVRTVLGWFNEFGLADR